MRIVDLKALKDKPHPRGAKPLPQEHGYLPGCQHQILVIPAFQPEDVGGQRPTRHHHGEPGGVGEGREEGHVPTVLPHTPLCLLAAHDAGEEARVAGVIPQEGEVGGGVGRGEPGPDPGLDLGQAAIAPAGAALGGAEARVEGAVLLLRGQVGAPLSIQAVQWEETNLWTPTLIGLQSNQMVQFNFYVIFLSPEKNCKCFLTL